MNYTRDSFSWREDDHTLEARCVFCAERIVWSHHARVTQILADVAEHAMRCGSDGLR
jgi:hypothetical protein